jgi:rhomboid protease GluP
MAIGFTPKHIEEYPLNNLTQQQFLALANDAAIKTGWKIGYLSDNGLIAYTDNGIFSWNAEIKIKIENGVAIIKSASTGNEIFDWGKNKTNVSDFVHSLEDIKSMISAEELTQKYQDLSEQLVPQDEDILALPPATTTEHIKDIGSIFIPTKGFFITPILLDLNILIFIVMVLSGVSIWQPDSESLLSWGANFRSMTLDGEWWRLITSCFLHIGIFHLLLNMYALLYIGVLLEPNIGRTRFIAAYLLTGITSSMTSLWWHDLTISAGASGAIFGIYGVFLAMLTTNLIEKTARKALLTSIAVFVGYNLIGGLKDGIDNAAHIGGLLGGLVIGYAFIPSLKRPQDNKLKYVSISFLAVIIFISSVVIYKNLPNDVGTYDAKMREFSLLETAALEVYDLPTNTPSEKMLDNIKEKGIYNWNENIKLINSCDSLDLPLEIRSRNRLLKEYCVLRIKSYELFYKQILEGTEEYNQQLEEYDKLINAKIKEIDGK